MREIRHVELISQSRGVLRVIALDEDGFMWLGSIGAGEEAGTADAAWIRVPEPADMAPSSKPDLDFWAGMERKLKERAEKHEQTS